MFIDKEEQKEKSIAQMKEGQKGQKRRNENSKGMGKGAGGQRGGRQRTRWFYPNFTSLYIKKELIRLAVQGNHS